MRRSLSCVLIAASFITLLAAPAHAKQNTYVAAYGADSGNCSYTAPCRNFSYALSVVESGGIVTAIDSAGYSPFTINKAVTIMAPNGVSPIILAPSGGTAITISAGSSDKIVLRGLTLEGEGAAGFGIDFESGASLTITDCFVRNMNGDGLKFVSNTSGSGTQTLTVSNSHFNDNAQDGLLIYVLGTGSVSAAIHGTEFSGNGAEALYAIGNGTTVNAKLALAITDSVFANTLGGSGIAAAGETSPVAVTLTRVLIEGNLTGIAAAGAAGSSGTVFLAQSTLTANSFEYQVSTGGAINSYGDNFAAGNTIATGMLGTATKQ
jgi:hypothetical protein